MELGNQVLDRVETSGEPSGRTRWRYGVRVSLEQREWLKGKAREECATVEKITTRLLGLAIEAAGGPPTVVLSQKVTQGVR